MNPLLYLPPFALQRSPSLSNDVEMLQTDVMRFFAILCLCLMAIFALVKALPMSPPDVPPTISEPSNLKAEAAALQKTIAALKDKLAKTQSQLVATTAAIKQSQVEAADATAIKQKTIARLSMARKELAAVAQSLKDAREEINAREAVLARLVKDITEKRRIRSDLQAQIENEKENYKKIQTTFDQATAKLNRTIPTQKPIPEQKPPAPVPPKPVKKGFTLRFDSDKALETLIAQRKVQFLVLAGPKAWKLKIANGRLLYVATKVPAKIYEMEATTVPAVYAENFNRQVAAFGREKITWGVTLPNQTTAVISRLVKNRDGGELIITSSGEVTLN